MIIIYVKHYLTETGLTFFKELWFPEVERIIKCQLGFFSIEASHDLENTECMRITLKFLDQTTLDAWVSTNEHDRVLKQLDAYRTKAWHYAVSQSDVHQREPLEWIEVQLIQSKS